MMEKSEKKVQKVWTNVHSVSNKSLTIYFCQNIVVELCTRKMWQQNLPHFF